MKLRLNVFDILRIDIEQAGAFLRSSLHERQGDPHGSFHWDPQPGTDNNTPHLTRRKQPRVWLPEFAHDRLLDFFARFQVAFYKGWLASIRPVDLVGAEAAGWCFCVSMPAGMPDSIFCETEPGHMTWNFSYEKVATLVEHTLVATERPTNFIGRGPSGPSPIISAVRWYGDEVAAGQSVAWLEYGAWDPFANGGPIQVGLPGWYWLPRAIVAKRAFLRALGPEGRKGMAVAAKMMAEFLGPIVRDVSAEHREVEDRIRLALKGRR